MKTINARTRAAARFAAFCTLFAASTAGAAEDLDFSGSIDTSYASVFGAEDAPEYSYGLEQYANLRLKANIGERGTVFVAANIIAASGEAAADIEPFVVGKNYAAAIEVERLYYRIESDTMDMETGLMRMAFGFGQAWSPSDFLSPKNPLLPDARPRGVLGAAVSTYPTDTVKFKAFALSGADSLDAEGNGAVFGATADAHGEHASVQGLYAFEAPTDVDDRGINYAGLSLKLEAEAGFVLDALFSLNADDPNGIEGLQATIGADYSFLNGDLYALLEYLYNGWGGVDTADRSGIEDNTNYLYGAFTYRFSDYTNATISCVASIDDRSFSPYLELSHEPFQGMTVSLSGRIPVGSSFGENGELGPEKTKSRALITAKVRLRF